MTNKQLSKFSMYQALESLLNENKSTWQQVPAFVAAFGLFSEKTTRLSEIYRERARKLAGISGSKRSKRKQLSESAEVISGALKALASSKQNEELRHGVNYKSSELKNLPQKDMVAACRNIYEVALEHKAQLTAFNIPEETLTGFGSLVSEYESMNSATRNAISTRKALGELQRELMAAIDILLADQLDAMIISFREPHPQFYKEYRINRILVDPRTSPTRFTGMVVDSATGEPVKHALVTVAGTPYLVNTRTDGSFKLRVPKPGIYTLQAERAGYATTTQEAELRLGKTTNVEMKIGADS